VAQIFHPSFNTLSRVSIWGSAVILSVVAGFLGILWRSPYVTEVGVIREQPIPFSHEHHVAGLGIDCRYCHTSVEESSFAGMPATSVCMNCHTHIWKDSPLLEPVRASFRTGQPLSWTRVHDVPDFAYFNHAIHVAKGVGCTTCHGQVDEMPLMWREHTLFMQWCLNCHRDPAPYLRPRSEVFSVTWKPGEPIDDDTIPRLAPPLTQKSDLLTSCSTCHR
jgi:hypothetical protein